MKRKLLILSILLIPFITGCGNSKQLICYDEINDGDFKQSLIMNYNKEKTKIESASIEIVIDINEIDLKTLECTKEKIEECLDELETKYKEGCNNLLENCEVKDKTEKGFTFTADIQNEKLDTYFNELGTTLPINQMKTKIENKFGFTCE